MKRGHRTAVVSILAGTLLIFGAAGCRATPTQDDLIQSGPDASGWEPRRQDSESVSDPFGPGADSGRFAEGDLSEENILPGGAGGTAWAEGRLQIVYFDFDQSSLTEQARAALEANAEFLQANPSIRVRVSGHCDERGTVEYNLALGDRRASAARQYMLQRGIEPARLEVVSFGEEQPADPGHNDTSWAKNRRAEFHVR